MTQNSDDSIEEVKKDNLDTQEIKENILKNEEKKEIWSEKFKILEEKVKEVLLVQDSVKAIEYITAWAMAFWSSDIHYDNKENLTVVRFRIDWILVNIFSLEKKEYKLVLERIKHSSNLKLNITNIPQDWKYELFLNNDKIDVRISSLPTPYWENIVSRILDSKKAIINFEDLWFIWTTWRMLEKAITKKNGLILVTWPTWSWKTTTLYTILSKLNSPDKKIITLEDPIEYRLDWVVQSEVNEKNWYSFQMWLKALLRQDPDVIMLWEIRDYETLQIATQASLTWHLVLSTLHTKSAADTLDRITNMWLKNYILASAIDTIIAQRLVRKICNHCKVEKQKTKEEEIIVQSMLNDIWIKNIPKENIKLYKWTWCPHCNNSWYKWRIWIYEIITLNDNLRNLIREWKSSDEMIKEARNSDLITIKEDWILKAMWWYTTIEEILRVI